MDPSPVAHRRDSCLGPQKSRSSSGTKYLSSAERELPKPGPGKTPLPLSPVRAPEPALELAPERLNRMQLPPTRHGKFALYTSFRERSTHFAMPTRAAPFSIRAGQSNP